MKDSLTCLPNSSFFVQYLERYLSQEGSAEKGLTLLIIDLDDFRSINLTYGRYIGNRIINHLAKRLYSLVSKDAVLARLGGDEFSLLFPLMDTEKAEQLAEQILQAIKQPFATNSHLISITASIGLALFPKDGRDATSLMKNVEKALYKAKQMGKDNYQFFNPSMHNEVYEKIILTRDLRYALKQDELIIHYQPQINLQNGQTECVEALLRWHNRELGLVSPDKFIPVAESSGLIVPIEEWVLRKACAQAKQWQKELRRPLRVAVNLSPVHFQDKNIVKFLTAVLQETGLEPHNLEIEITESVPMHNVKLLIKKLKCLQDMGVKIAMDDFGKGYSSFSFLKNIPLNILKIDKCFIQDIDLVPEYKIITNTIIKMARSLNLKAVAEGVETKKHLAFLQESKCDLAQGFFFSRPVPAEKIKDLLA